MCNYKANKWPKLAFILLNNYYETSCAFQTRNRVVSGGWHQSGSCQILSPNSVKQLVLH